MGGCCESSERSRKDCSFMFPSKTPTICDKPNEFSFRDVVPIKYHHYMKEYEFEKNLPSIKQMISKT